MSAPSSSGAAAVRRQSANPFDTADNEVDTPESAPPQPKSASQNPFDAAVESCSSGNPFGDEDDSAGARAAAASSGAKGPSALPPQPPSNPIGFPVRRGSNVLNGNLNKSTPSPGPNGGNDPADSSMCTDLNGVQVTLVQAYQHLQNFGFLPEYVRPSLLATRDARKSLAVLTQKVREICLVDAYGTAPGLWKSPLAVRVGSWMPVKEPGGGTTVTLYYVSVTVLHSSHGYQVTKRYSEFHALYLALYNDLVKSFARKGMQNLFPDDRVSSWFSGESDALRNSRREYLDGWLREVCLSATLMLQSGPRGKVLDFLGAAKFLPIAS